MWKGEYQVRVLDLIHGASNFAEHSKVTQRDPDLAMLSLCATKLKWCKLSGDKKWYNSKLDWFYSDFNHITSITCTFEGM